jgi:hypothetical protein
MGIMDWMRTRLVRTAARQDPLAAEAVERIVRLANPRLVFAHRYRSRLTPAARNAMNYAAQLVMAAAPAREASAAAWQTDHCIRSMFATSQEVGRTFSRSPEVRAWFRENPAAREICTVLSMQLVERRVLGVAFEEGVLQREVPQTTVSFTDHRARICAATEQDLRQELERRIVDQLALAAVALAAQDESRRVVLEQERALLRARLRLLGAKGAGISGLGLRVSPEMGDLARLQLELAVNEQNLRALASGSEDLDYQVECMCTTLTNPADHFSVSARRIRLDNLNIVLPDDSTTPGATLDLQIARVPIPDAAPEFRTFVLARFPRAELISQAELLREASAMLR